MSVTTIVLLVVGGLLALFLVSLLTATVRNEVALGILNGLFKILGWPLYAAIELLDWLRNKLDALTKWAHDGMVEAWNRPNKISSSRTSAGPPVMKIGAIDEFMAAALFGMFIIIFLADLAIAAIRIPELIGAKPLPINGQVIDYLLVGYWVSSIVGGVAIWADAWGVTHFLPFFTLAEGNTRKLLKYATLTVLVLIVLGGILQGIFQWRLTSGTSLPFVDALLNVVITVVGFLALGELGIAFPYEFLGAFVLFPSMLRLVPTLLGFILNIPLALLDRIAGVLVSLYDMVARFGYNFWNWLSDLSTANSWRLRLPPMRRWDDRPHIAGDFALKGVTF